MRAVNHQCFFAERLAGLWPGRRIGWLRRGWPGLFSLTVAVTVAAGQMPDPAVSAPAIRIGLLLPPGEPEAGFIEQGAERAARERAGQGRRVELVVRGRPGQWGTEGDEAVVLVHEDQVDAVVAPALGASAHQVLQVAGRTRVPVVSLCPDSSVTGPGIPWTLRIVPRSDDQAQAIFAALNRPHSRLAVAALVPPDRAGREATRDLRTAASVGGVDLAEPVVWTADQTPDALAARLLASQPFLVLVWLDAVRATATLEALARAGYAGRVAVPCDLVNPRFLPARGDSALAVLAAVPADWPLGAGAAPNLPAAMAQDAVNLLAAILDVAGRSPSFQQFPLTNSFAGLTGPLAFDRYGNRQLKLAVVELRAGRWQALTSAPP
jgi:ABC-type branched-subunit amino acid transport system substrate-binding protein